MPCHRVVSIIVATFVGGCALARDKRPSTWAQPVDLAGVNRLYRVADGVYRCGNPSECGWENLRKKLGIRTAVSLERVLYDTKLPEGIEQVRVGVSPLFPNTSRFADALRVMADPKRRPVLVYCLRGADRSSWLCAHYRVVVQGWTPDEALREMDWGGYGNLLPTLGIRAHLRGMDAAALRKELNLPAPQTQPATQPASQTPHSVQVPSFPETQPKPQTQPASQPCPTPDSP